MIKNEWIAEHGGKEYYTEIRSSDTNEVLFRRKHVTSWKGFQGLGMYVEYYKRLWNKFLREHIDDSEKKFNSPFKKGESYNFRLKENGAGNNIQHS